VTTRQFAIGLWIMILAALIVGGIRYHLDPPKSNYDKHVEQLQQQGLTTPLQDALSMMDELTTSTTTP